MSALDQITLLILATFGLASIVLALIPGLADGLIRVITSLRELKQTISGRSARTPPAVRGQAEQQRSP